MPVPKTFLVGHTILTESIVDYLRYTDQLAFMDDVAQFHETVPGTLYSREAVTMISCFAKMCYKSLVPGKNSNIRKTRDIESNFKGIIESGHGSVLEHVTFNFITTDCSRVFTHELVRHRVGTAFSQTSGRYVRLDDVQVVLPPELREHEGVVNDYLHDLSSHVDTLEALVGLKGWEAAWEIAPSCDEATCADQATYLESLGFYLDATTHEWTLPMDVKKRLTSAIRRIAPNGQTNEIAWSCNLRSLRHMIELRTSRHAEWEIRHVFNEVASLIEERCPLMLYGGTKSEPDEHYGLCEWTGLHV
jgi:thymidylate synthase (FAD)